MISKFMKLFQKKFSLLKIAASSSSHFIVTDGFKEICKKVTLMILPILYSFA
jgi:hypothetical protein